MMLWLGVGCLVWMIPWMLLAGADEPTARGSRL